MSLSQPIPNYDPPKVHGKMQSGEKDKKNKPELQTVPSQQINTKQINPMIEALGELEKSLAYLSDASEEIIGKQTDNESSKMQIQRLAQDRADLARQLNNSQTRADTLKQVNKQVSNRLVSVMEKIRQLDLDSAEQIM